MNPIATFRAKVHLTALAFVGFVLFAPFDVRAQDEGAAVPDSALAEDRFENESVGGFSPGTGFDIIRTKRGRINISLYGLFRYLNQTPGDQTFTDHLGRTRTVAARNDLNWHRSFIMVERFLLRPAASVHDLGVVSPDHRAEFDVRPAPLCRQPGLDVRSGGGPEPHRPVPPRVLALLGGE